ncbi:MAG TPA: pantoate--beta-alanine ligase [Patescibacteria group bacterium]|nr:pantoate--beta-alanine ligase [Patescibacteria group bacterium]
MENRKISIAQPAEKPVAGKAPLVINTVAALREFVSSKREAGLSIALVPTMGALHEGHLELVRQGRKKAEVVIVSIFVNPTQFGPNEDYVAYPRTWEADLSKLTQVGAHAVFHPAAQEMYPHGFNSIIHVKGVSETLEGILRPGHFDGVATVVTKLLLQSQPDVALFGEKDFQQLAVIRQLVADINIPVEIIGVPIVRDEKGLALSSRNAYLSAAQYEIAINLNKTLFNMARKLKGGDSFVAVQDWGKKALLDAGFESVDYVEFRDAQTLQIPGEGTDRPLRLLAAARIGRTRLIDNIAV